MTESQSAASSDKKTRKTKSTRRQQSQQPAPAQPEMGLASSSTAFDYASDAASADASQAGPSSAVASSSLTASKNEYSGDVGNASGVAIPPILGLHQHAGHHVQSFEPAGYASPPGVGALPKDESELSRLHGLATTYFDQLARFPYDDARHTPALRHIADHDAWLEPGPTWDDELRLALQHRLLNVFRAYPHPDLVQPELHRAAPLIPLLLQRHQQQVQQAQQQHLAQVGGLGVGGPLPLQHQQASFATGAFHTEGGEGGITDGDADTSFNALSLEAQNAQAALASRFLSASTLDAAASALNISTADLSSFYPSKRHLHQFMQLQQQQQHQRLQHHDTQEQQGLPGVNVASSGANPSAPASAPAGADPSSVPAHSADQAGLAAASATGVPAGPSASASQHLSALYNNGRPLTSGPPLYAAQIPLRHAEIKLYQLLQASFSVEPTRRDQDWEGMTDAANTSIRKSTGGDAHPGRGEMDKDDLQAGDRRAATSSDESDNAVGRTDSASNAIDSKATLPASTSSSSMAGVGPNTSTLPIHDASTPLFLHSPPFTIQRLAELALNEPGRHHSSSTKFLHALERVLRVTATWDSVQARDAAVANGTEPTSELDGGGILPTGEGPSLVPLRPGSMGPGATVPLGVPAGMVDEVEAADTLAAVASNNSSASSATVGSAPSMPVTAASTAITFAVDQGSNGSAAPSSAGADATAALHSSTTTTTRKREAEDATEASSALQSGTESDAASDISAAPASSDSTATSIDSDLNNGHATATATSTAERTIKRMRSERSLKGK